MPDKTMRLTLTRPDDWHLHVRDGAILQAVVPHSARVFGRAIIMPNLVPPVTTAAQARDYRKRIEAAVPANAGFKPLMTCYLTDDTDGDDLIAGFEAGVFAAAKLYPAGATTNSESGVTAIGKIHNVLARMEAAGMPLLVHGEVAGGEVDIFDREAVFIERVLDPVRDKFPALKIVLEHITTEDAVRYVLAAGTGLGATITPHHLVINRNALFAGGISPHMFCLPIAKRERHRQALVDVAVSGDKRFFLGTDSAPHLKSLKQSACGCAGIFNAPIAIPYAADVFEAANALDKLEAFVALNGAEFYGLEANGDQIVLEKIPAGDKAGALREIDVPSENDAICVFHVSPGPNWRIAER